MWGIFSHRCANPSPSVPFTVSLVRALWVPDISSSPLSSKAPTGACASPPSGTVCHSPFFLSPPPPGRFLLALPLPLLLSLHPQISCPQIVLQFDPALLFLCSFLSLSVVCSVSYPTPACLIPALPVHLPMSHSQHSCLTIKFPAWLRPPVVTSHVLLLNRRLYLLSLWCH